jgi:hypothetical protein
MTGTIAESRDIVVTINHGLDEYEIGFIQQIEAQIDKALAPVGFSRSLTSKGGDKVELTYYRFGFTVTKTFPAE